MPFNSIGISKISSNHVFSPIPKQFYYRAKPDIMKNWVSVIFTKLQRSEFFIPILTNNVFVGKVQWRRLYWKFFSFESFVTRYKLQKTSLKLISVSISDFHLEMPFIESTSKFSSVLSLLYISFDKLLEFRIVLIKWLLYSVFAMLFTFLLLMG